MSDGGEDFEVQPPLTLQTSVDIAAERTLLLGDLRSKIRRLVTRIDVISLDEPGESDGLVRIVGQMVQTIERLVALGIFHHAYTSSETPPAVISEVTQVVHTFSNAMQLIGDLIVEYPACTLAVEADTHALRNITIEVRGSLRDLIQELESEIGTRTSGIGDRNWIDVLFDELAVTYRSLQDVLADIRYWEADQVAMRANEALLAANQSAENATESAEAAREAAGAAGDSGTATYFNALESSQEDSANRFRAWTIAMMVAGSTLAAFLLLVPAFGNEALDLKSGDYVHLIQRLLLVGGVFTLAGYFSRQSHNHRIIANWAQGLAAQLKTFEAYNKPIKDATVRDELRKQFAARVFGDPPNMKGESTTQDSGDALAKAIELVSKFTPGGKS